MRKLLSLQGRTPTDEVMLTIEQASSLQASMWRWFRSSPSGWLLFIAVLLAPMAIFTIGMAVYYNLIQPHTPDNPVVRFLFPIVVQVIGGSLVALLGFYLAIRHVWEPRYRKELRAIGYELCERCDYRLDGLENTAPCPECGAAR